MQAHGVRLLASVLALASSIGAFPSVARAARTLVVDDDGIQCPSPDFPTISMALAAATNGTTIQVCPGDYPEAINIAGFDKLTLKGVGSPLPVVRPPGVFGFSGPIVSVSGSQDVTIQGLYVDGFESFGATTTSMYGIAFADSSGKIVGNYVQRIRNSPAGTSAEGTAIDVSDTTDFVQHKVAILDNVLNEYQTNGIVLRGEIEARVKGNLVQGSLPGFAGTQHGIELAYNATGKVMRNLVNTSNDSGYGVWLYETYGVKVAKNDIYDTSTGVMIQSLCNVSPTLFQSAYRNKVTANTLAPARYGVVLEADDGPASLCDPYVTANSVSRNEIHAGASPFVGIWLVTTDTGPFTPHVLTSRITGNAISGFPSGIVDGGTATTLSHNVCDGAPCP